jgi:hypothetical protein
VIVAPALLWSDISGGAASDAAGREFPPLVRNRWDLPFEAERMIGVIDHERADGPENGKVRADIIGEVATRHTSRDSSPRLTANHTTLR